MGAVMLKNIVATFPLRLAGKMLSPAGPKARLSILIYHRVREQRDVLFPQEVDAILFERQMKALQSVFNVLPLSEAIERLETGSLPSRAACITFDDGYADNAEIALPILSRAGLCATFFVASGYLGRGVMFNDQIAHAIQNTSKPVIDLQYIGLGRHVLSDAESRKKAVISLISKTKYLPQIRRQIIADEISAASAVSNHGLMMSPDQVRALHAAGMEIGAHTVSHPILSKIDPLSARNEICESRERLQEIIRAPVSLFAYPNGKPGIDYHESHVKIVRNAGFKGAVTTAPGVSTQNSDRYQLPRFTPWDASVAKFAARLVANLAHVERAEPENTSNIQYGPVYL